MNVLVQYMPQFESGMLTTIALTLLAFVGALSAGIVVAILRVCPVPILRGVGTVYVETLQNIPLLALLVISIFALPEVGLQADLFTTAALTIAIYEAAFIAEAIRAGINTVALGQSEAARALGLTFGQSLRFVIMPQASSSPPLLAISSSDAGERRMLSKPLTFALKAISQMFLMS